jgi:N-acetylneuraminic acid mutarotase
VPRALTSVLFAALAACTDPQPPGPTNSAWSLGPELPSPRLEPGVTSLGQRLIVVGGFDQNVAQGLRITTEVLSLDPLTGTWSNLPDAPVAWTHANIAGSSSTLYLLGGLDTNSFLARGESFALDLDLPDPQWRAIASMPDGMERGAAAVMTNPPHIYLIGGASTSDALATVLDYDFSTDSWSMLPDLPMPRSHGAAMRQEDGTLIVAGGLSSLDSSRPLGDVWALPLHATEWQPRAPMRRARGGCAYGTVFGHLICAGGEAGTGAVETVETYDPNTDTWTTQEDMPERRAGTRGAVIGGQLYVPGGASALQFEPTATLYVFAYLATLQP